MNSRIPIVDCHCHIYPEKVAARAVAGIGAFYDIPMYGDGTRAMLQREAAEAGITHSMIFSVATKPAQVRSINEFIAQEVAVSGGSMTGLGTMHPLSEDMEGDMQHLLSLDLRGVKLHPDFQRFALDDVRCMRVYELCEGRLPILIHTGDHRYDYSNPNRMMPILEIYKNLTVIGAHFGGWSVWEEATERLKGYENFLVDCSSSLYALTPERARELIMAYGVKRVLFGTDYPLWTPETEIERFMQIDLTDEERRDILYNNAANLFGIE